MTYVYVYEDNDDDEVDIRHSSNDCASNIIISRSIEASRNMGSRKYTIISFAAVIIAGNQSSRLICTH